MLDLVQLWRQAQSLIDRLPPRFRSRKLWMAIVAIAVNFRNPVAVLRIVSVYLGAQGAEDAAKQFGQAKAAQIAGGDAETDLRKALKAQGLEDVDIEVIVEKVEAAKNSD